MCLSSLPGLILPRSDFLVRLSRIYGLDFNAKTHSSEAATEMREAFGVRGIPPLLKHPGYATGGNTPALQTLRVLADVGWAPTGHGCRQNVTHETRLRNCHWRSC